MPWIKSQHYQGDYKECASGAEPYFAERQNIQETLAEQNNNRVTLISYLQFLGNFQHFPEFTKKVQLFF